MLKYTRLSGPAKFEFIPCVWIFIQETQDTFGEGTHSLTARFLRWACDNKIYTCAHAGHAGGGSFAGAYLPNDAEKIKRWLEENGAEEGTHDDG